MKAYRRIEILAEGSHQTAENVSTVTVLKGYVPNPRPDILTLVVAPTGDVNVTVSADFRGTPYTIQNVTATANTLTVIPIDGYYDSYDIVLSVGSGNVPTTNWRLLGGGS